MFCKLMKHVQNKQHMGALMSKGADGAVELGAMVQMVLYGYIMQTLSTPSQNI